MIHNDFIELTQEVKKTLKYLAESGCKGFDCSEKSLKSVQVWGQVNRAEEKNGGAVFQKQPIIPERRPVSEPASERVQQDQAVNQTVTHPVTQIETLESIRSELGNCQRCNLGTRRKNIVYGAGNPNARLVFVGEAPGFEEDVQGQPFVGASGQLLTKMIQAMGINRQDVYICNVLKCRPTDNRNPLPEEIVTCLSFLKKQLAVIKPEVICTMGGFATQALLEKPDGITRLRGRFYEYNGIKLMPVYHPAYLLRNAEKKRETWEDLQKIMALLGLKRT